MVYNVKVIMVDTSFINFYLGIYLHNVYIDYKYNTLPR